VVTHLTTNPPVSCLNRAERTGSLALKILWSYVNVQFHNAYIYYSYWEAVLAVIERERDMACQPGSSVGSAEGFFGGCAGLFVVMMLVS
jgi:hypothetical protein